MADGAGWENYGASPKFVGATFDRMMVDPLRPNLIGVATHFPGGSLPMPSVRLLVGSPPFGTSDTGIRPPLWALLQLTVVRSPPPLWTSQAPKLGTMGPQ